MLRNYFIIALRNLARNKLHGIINISGLAIGLASAILIVSFVNFEFSYDRFLEDHQRIYRVVHHEQDKNEDTYQVAVYPNYHREVYPIMPEIEHSTRLTNRSFFGTTDLIRVGSELFPDQKVYYGDSTFFDVFSFGLINFSTQYPLAGKDHAVITRAAALRYFGTPDVLEKRILLNDREEFIITGIMEDIPGNCHFHFDVLLSMENHYWESQANWNNTLFATYFKLRPGTDPDHLREKINNFLKNHEIVGRYIGENFLMEVFLQPIEKIHLHSHFDKELEANNSFQYVMIFLTIAIIILLIASINYINLETARSVERAKEVGIRKVFGGEKKVLIRQFMGESLLTVLIAFLISLGLAEMIRPFFNNLIGIPFTFSFLFSGLNLFWIFLILAFLAFFSGFYPALVLSGYSPDQVLKGKYSRSRKGVWLRKTLVIFQFAISASLIIGSIVIYRQMDYMKNKNLGIHKDQVIVIPMITQDVVKNQQLIKSEFTKHTRILSGSAVSQIPVNITLKEGISFNKGWSVDDPLLYTLEADPDVFKTLGLKFIEGRNFNHEYSGSYTEYIINEEGSKLLGPDILNMNIRVKHGGVTLGPVVGIIQDFNFSSLHSRIAPLVISQNPGNYQFLLFNVKTEDIGNTLAYMKKSWERILPDLPFDFQFLSQAYENLYQMEAKAGNMMFTFTVIALVIAFSGLFGLSSFTALRRTKEVGLRKVLGSALNSIVFMFVRENMKLVLFAFIIAVPVGYFFMNRWLTGFAYHIRIGFDIMLISLGSVMIIATLSIIYQAVRAAMANPVDTLRYE
jgi:putative ABC transport system permease protein